MKRCAPSLDPPLSRRRPAPQRVAGCSSMSIRPSRPSCSRCGSATSAWCHCRRYRARARRVTPLPLARRPSRPLAARRTNTSPPTVRGPRSSVGATQRASAVLSYLSRLALLDRARCCRTCRFDLRAAALNLGISLCIPLIYWCGRVRPLGAGRNRRGRVAYCPFTIEDSLHGVFHAGFTAILS